MELIEKKRKKEKRKEKKEKRKKKKERRRKKQRGRQHRKTAKIEPSKPVIVEIETVKKKRRPARREHSTSQW